MKLNTELFIQRAKEVHGDLYDYSRVVYERSTKKVEIICRTHGIFLQRPENHVNQRQHCPQCANAHKGKHERFSMDWMIERPEKAYAPALLYVMDVHHKVGDYLEVGISTKSIKRGYKATPNTTLVYLQYMSLKEALLLVGKIENTLKEYASDTLNFSTGKTRRLKNQPAVRTALEEILPKS